MRNLRKHRDILGDPITEGFLFWAKTYLIWEVAQKAFFSETLLKLLNG